jgi:nickel-dependent lactate racemase
MGALSETEISIAIDKLIGDYPMPLKRVLLIPPDGTRSHSGGGLLTRMLFDKLKPFVCCDVLPALGTHAPMTKAELGKFFPGIPQDGFITHNWRSGLTKLGEIPGGVMAELSGGRMTQAVPVEVNRALTDGGYDLIVSIGQVVPHEVAGMANYTKNILVGCGGAGLINASHMLSVYGGFEKYLGVDHSPVRRLFDYAQRDFLSALPIVYVMTVTTAEGSADNIQGLFIGRERSAFEEAVKLSRRLNITRVSPAIKTCVVNLSPDTYRSAWLGNKAVYRTRNAIADGGELIILFPGFERFGEDTENDRLIRMYGYRGREAVLALMDKHPELKANMSAAAHLIHGSSDGRFTIRYCTAPKHRDEVLSVGYEWGDIEEYTARYANAREPLPRTALFNGADSYAASAYYIDNPALGLWLADDFKCERAGVVSV